MPNINRQRRVGPIWLLVAVLSLVALALSLWDMIVERDGGNDWIMQALFPLLLAIFAVTMYRKQSRARGGIDAQHTEEPR